MIYRILYNKQEIYGPNLNMAVLNPTLELELNAAGRLEFTLPVTRSETTDDDGNPIWPDSVWNNIQVFNGEIEVWEEEDCIFFGRPLQIVRDWNNQKRVICEGALAYFNDTIQPTKEYKKEADVKKTPLYTGEPYTDSSEYYNGFFNTIIDNHNQQLRTDNVDDHIHSIYVGNVDVDNELVWRKTDFETTASCLQSMCLDTNGGYFILRKEWDESWQDYKNVIDWYKQPPYGTGQEIIFGLNLLDISQDLNGSDLCTVLYPTGDGDLTVVKASTRGWNNPYVMDNVDPTTEEHYDTHLIHEANSHYIIHKEGFEKYGRIVKQKSFETTGEEDTVENANELCKKAIEWLNEQNYDEIMIECSAADLHYVSDQTPYGENAPGKLMLGQMILVNDSVHNVTRKLPIYKLSMSLDSGIKKITMGTPPKKELTDIVKTSTSSSTRNTSGGNADSGGSSGGSSGGTVSIPVKDVQVKYPNTTEYASVVKKKIAKIDLSDLGGSSVKDVLVNGTSVVDQQGNANVVVPPQPTIPVTDVTLDGVSVVTGTIAEFNSSVFGTKVEANPQDDPTDNLTTIKIDNTIYDLDPGANKYEHIIHNSNNQPSSNYGEITDVFFETDVDSSEKTIIGAYYYDEHNIEHYTVPSNLDQLGGWYVMHWQGVQPPISFWNPDKWNEEKQEWGDWDWDPENPTAYSYGFEFDGQPGRSEPTSNVFYGNVDGTVYPWSTHFVSTYYKGFAVSSTSNVPLIYDYHGERMKPTHFTIQTGYNLISQPRNAGPPYLCNVDVGGVMVNVSNDGENWTSYQGVRINDDDTIYEYEFDIPGYYEYIRLLIANVTYVRIGFRSFSLDGVYEANIKNIWYKTQNKVWIKELDKVSANPSDTASADLSKIKIGNDVYGVATPTDIATLQSNFQDGVDAIYDACVAKGSTPASQSLSDVVQGIMDIPQGSGSLGVKTITANGVYEARDDNYDGYSKVTVSVNETISFISDAEADTLNEETALSTYTITGLSFTSEVTI